MLELGLIKGKTELILATVTVSSAIGVVLVNLLRKMEKETKEEKSSVVSQKPQEILRIDLAFFSYRSSQCLSDNHCQDYDLCSESHCSRNNKACLIKLIKSAKNSIKIAMYMWSVRDIYKAVEYAKETNGVKVKVIMDNKMRKTQGTVFMDMVASGFQVRWPPDQEDQLMHHKFMVIDADEPSNPDDPYPEGNTPLRCEYCTSEPCNSCGMKSIYSKKDLLQFPGETLPRLPKYGVLITGSLNWSMQAFNKNYENTIVSSDWRLIGQVSKEFDYLWSLFA